MNIEIKPCPGQEYETGKRVAKDTASYFEQELLNPSTDQIPLFSSFSFDALAAAREETPSIPRALLVEEIPTNWYEMLFELKAVALHCDHKYLTKEVASEVKAKGFGLFCYTVNNRDRAKELITELGVDSFCTDRLDIISEAMFS